MKLEVEECANGYHVYMVGESFYGGCVTRCMVDLQYDVLWSAWTLNFSQERGAVYFYDDVAVTDNEIVFVGHKNGSSGQYIVSFPRPFTAAIDIFSLSPSPLNYFMFANCNANPLPFTPFLIEHLVGDYYAVTGYANLYSYGVAGTMLTIYNGTGNLHYQCLIPQSAYLPSWEQRDLRFNQYTKTLCLLQKMSAPVWSTMESTLCEFIVSPAMTVSAANAFREPNAPAYTSMDSYSQNGVCVSASINALVDLWHHKIPTVSTPCADSQTLPYYVNTCFDNIELYPYYPIDTSVRPVLYDIHPRISQVILNCH